jgi:hypothetical protein
MDRKLTMDTIEKMKQPKSRTHKKNISQGMTLYWQERKQQESLHYKEVEWHS